MKLARRLYNDNEDYWRIREFLRQVMLFNNRRDLSWHVTRWDDLFWSIKPEFGKRKADRSPPSFTLKIAGACSCKSTLIFAQLNSKKKCSQPQKHT
jgi:hypothetical protein